MPNRRHPHPSHHARASLPAFFSHASHLSQASRASRASFSFSKSLLLAGAALACSLLLAGCETFRAWGEKGSSTPGTLGGSFSVPLGKK